MTIDPNRLRISVTEGERWRRELEIVVPHDLVQRERARVTKRLSKQIRLPGFRKGRIPSHVLLRHYGASVEQETIENVVNATVRAAVTREGLDPISSPDLADFRSDSDHNLHLRITFDVQPEIDIARSGGFVVERPSTKVSEADIQRVIDRLRRENGAWRPVEDGFPTPGEVVAVSILQLDDDGAEPMDYEFVLGEGDAVPDVERAIEELEVGTEGEFLVRFPDDFPDETRRGEEHRLRIRLESRTVLDLPALDDDFAGSLNFENLAELRSRVESDLLKALTRKAEETVRTRIMDFILEANAFDPPVSMVERFTDSLIESQIGPRPDAENEDEASEEEEKLKELKEMLRPQAEKKVRALLAIRHFADKHDLHATVEETTHRTEEIARSAEADSREALARLYQSGHVETIKHEITENKVFDFLKQQSDIIETG